MSAEHVTVSRVLMTRQEENKLLRRWCDEAAKGGGRFTIEQRYVDAWYTDYTIVWPDAAAPQGGKE